MLATWDFVYALIIFFDKSFHCIVFKLSLLGQLLHEIPLHKLKKKVSAVLEWVICFHCVILIFNNILPNILLAYRCQPFSGNGPNDVKYAKQYAGITKKLCKY